MDESGIKFWVRNICQKHPFALNESRVKILTLCYQYFKSKVIVKGSFNSTVELYTKYYSFKIVAGKHESVLGTVQSMRISKFLYD